MNFSKKEKNIYSSQLNTLNMLNKHEEDGKYKDRKSLKNKKQSVFKKIIDSMRGFLTFLTKISRKIKILPPYY